jgi:tetratricopeptide (TPR) repeat protein
MRSIRTAATTTKLLAIGLAAGFTATSLGCSLAKRDSAELVNEGDSVKGANLDEAISKYDQAATLDPTNRIALWKLALAYHKKEDWAKDAVTCSKAESVAPTFANFHLEHGYALEQQAVKGPTSWAEAKEPLQQAIAKDPNLAQAYEELAEVSLHLDDEQGALQNYTKAIEIKPDELQFYPPLADLYLRLGYQDRAEQVLREALAFAKEGDKHLFAVHSFIGSIDEAKQNMAGAVTEYEAAKKVCGACNEAGQQIAFFNLGVAYAEVQPPRKNEAIQQLQSFSKIVCRGAAAARYADQCSQAQEFVKRLGGTVQ